MRAELLVAIVDRPRLAATIVFGVGNPRARLVFVGEGFELVGEATSPSRLVGSGHADDLDLLGVVVEDLREKAQVLHEAVAVLVAFRDLIELRERRRVVTEREARIGEHRRAQLAAVALRREHRW